MMGNMTVVKVSFLTREYWYKCTDGEHYTIL